MRIDAVEAAARRIAGHVRRTPALTSSSLDALAGVRLVLKAENLQRTGSFKARGAFNALLAMSADDRARGVLAVSSGNHGQAVALAARELGARCVVVMPSDANPVKVAATRAYGAEVVMHGVTAQNREDVVRRIASQRELTLVHPFDDERVMAGQGTAGLELTEQTERLDAVVVPVGGGGLLSGVAVAVKARWPSARVVGVEPTGAADVQASVRAGRRVALQGPADTVVDGVRTPLVGARPWKVISRLVDDVVTVTDAQALRSMELVWQRVKTVVEPAAGLGVAAVVHGKVEASTVGVILSGGNVDLDAWSAARSR